MANPTIAHRLLSGDQVHEDKIIVDSLTTDAGKVLTMANFPNDNEAKLDDQSAFDTARKKEVTVFNIPMNTAKDYYLAAPFEMRLISCWAVVDADTVADETISFSLDVGGNRTDVEAVGNLIVDGSVAGGSNSVIWSDHPQITSAFLDVEQGQAIRITADGNSTGSGTITLTLVMQRQSSALDEVP